MLEILLSKKAQDFLRDVHPRHAKQIKSKLLDLRNDPYPHDSRPLTGYDYFRADIGEYRIVYKVEDNKLCIPLIGKRNDDEVYKKLRRMN